jgi:hypothetical protein
MVEAKARVPDWVPHGVRDRRDVRDAVVDQDEVEIAVRGGLAPTQAAYRYECKAGPIWQQRGQPTVEQLGAFKPTRRPCDL